MVSSFEVVCFIQFHSRTLQINNQHSHNVGQASPFSGLPTTAFKPDENLPDMIAFHIRPRIQGIVPSLFQEGGNYRRKPDRWDKVYNSMESFPYRN